MTSQDTEALKALVADAKALQKQLDDGDGAYPQDYHDIFGKLEAALPALERMLAETSQTESRGDAPTGFILTHPNGSIQILHDRGPDGYELRECKIEPITFGTHHGKQSAEAHPVAPGIGWQPIETAPTSRGARALLWWDNEVVPGIYVDNSDTKWPWKGWSQHSGEVMKKGQPTMWRPMPLPPLAAAEQAGSPQENTP